MAKALQHALSKYDPDESGEPSEPHEYPGGEAGEHDPWGGQPTVGPQEHGPNSPSHGAAGGTAIDFPYRGNPSPSRVSTGLSWPDPEAGGGSPKRARVAPKAGSHS